jgi:hypothetical protein
MTPFGLIVIALCVVGLARWGPRSLTWLAAASVPLYDSAAVTVGGLGLSPFYVIVVVQLVLRFAAERPPSPRDGAARRDTTLMALFWVACTCATILGPAVFGGVDVVASGIGLDDQVDSLTRLAFSVSNAAQILYLTLNLAFVWLVARERLDVARLLTVVFGTGTVLALAALLAPTVGLEWPRALFDNNPRNFYSNLDSRLRGPMAEPSHLGIFALAGFAFFGARLLMARHARAVACFAAWLLASGVVLLRTESGTALGGAAVTAVVASAVVVVRLIRSPRTRVPVPGFLLLVALCAAAAVALDPVLRYARTIVESKQGSMSQSTRGYVDAHAYSLAWDTFGMGVGLGSNRASSLLALLLSSVGIVGTLLFAALVLRCFSRALRSREGAAPGLALLAYVAAAVVSSASFSSPVLWTLIAAGLSTYVVHAPPAPLHTASGTVPVRGRRTMRPAALEPSSDPR